MLRREALDIVTERLAEFDSVAILGPRQSGKSTLAREIAAIRGEQARFLDLERESDRRLLDDPEAWFTANLDKLVILDEIHLAPEIFRTLRASIDQRRRTGAKGAGYLILGSASMTLLRQSSESLAGRITYVEMGPLTLSEVAQGGNDRQVLDRLWLRGGFPLSFGRETDSASLRWREDFVRAYLERDIPQFGFSVAAERMGRFWRMLAHEQGELLNVERLARSLGVSGTAIRNYIRILEDLLLVRTLSPWTANLGKRLVKSPRTFTRDSGVLHALLGLEDIDDLLSHPVAGKSWEGLVIEILLMCAGDRVRASFYRTAAGAEADLVLEMPDGAVWAIEIKLSTAPVVERGFHNACDDLRAVRRIVVHRGEHAFPMKNGIEALPLLTALKEVREAALT